MYYVIKHCFASQTLCFTVYYWLSIEKGGQDQEKRDIVKISHSLQGITPVIIFTICFYIGKKIIKNKFIEIVSNDLARNVIYYQSHLLKPEK